jgi:hypothetical protein
VIVVLIATVLCQPSAGRSAAQPDGGSIAIPVRDGAAVCAALIVSACTFIGGRDVACSARPQTSVDENI